MDTNSSHPDRLAVSFCNTAGKGAALIAFLDADGRVESCEISDGNLTSACGLAQDGNYLYAACSSTGGTSTLLIFDIASRAIVERLPLDSVNDVHSICHAPDGAIVAASTGTDEVVRFYPRHASRPEVVWRAGPTQSDTHHVNSVAYDGDHLLCSAFGPRTADRWYTARNGYVFDIEVGQYVLSGLYHPHSVRAFGGDVYVCESSASRLVCRQGPVFTFGDGYVRGLAFGSRDVCLVGTSRGRAQTTLPGEVLNPADPGRITGTCGVHVLQVSEQCVETKLIDLSAYAHEIYDIQPLTSSG